MAEISEKTPLISIIIPVYNTVENLDRCLCSVKEQLYSNIEVIIINDGSTDNSGSICEKYVEADKRFKYIYQNNAGVSAARNRGLREKNGDYYTFIDSDDWIDVSYCKKMLDKALETQADIVFCGINYHKGIDVVQNDESEAMQDIIENRNIEHFFPQAKVKALGSSCRTLFRTNKLRQLYFDEELHIYEDLMFLLQNVEISSKLASVPEHLYHYDLPQTIYTKKYYRDGMTEKCIAIGNKLYEILMRFGREDLAKAELFYQYCMAVEWISKSCNTNKKLLYKSLKNNNKIQKFNSKENCNSYYNVYGGKTIKTKLIRRKMYNLLEFLRSVKRMGKHK